MESRLTGLSAVDLRKLAFEYAEKLKVKHNFNKDERLAGKDWLRGFMNRNYYLSTRKLEHTSAAKANGFNQESVSEFFSLLQDILQKYEFTPDRIWNVDEIGNSVVPKTSPKVIAKKGKKQVGGESVAERGETVTAEICMSAAGVFMPPMLIFSRVKENLQLLEGAPPGGFAELHRTGYMKTDIFGNWGIKFVEFSHATLDNPVLLILDGYVSHIKNLKFIEYAKANGVVFMDPLNNCFGKEIATLQQQHVTVNLKNIFSIFGKAFIKAAKMETAIHAFKKY